MNKTMKHTQGKWELRGTNIASQIDGMTVIIAAAHDLGIPDKSEQKANARLIAAAPELLEALQLAVQRMELEEMGIHEPLNVKAAIATANRVISKATGS